QPHPGVRRRPGPRGRDRADVRAHRPRADDPIATGASQQICRHRSFRPNEAVGVPMAAPELVVGILPSARMRTTDYDLIVTDRRLVGAKIGTPGLAPAAGFVLGGVVGYSIGRGLSRGQATQRARYAGLRSTRSLGPTARTS